MKRVYSFDFIKFFAIIGVVIIHSGIFWNLNFLGLNYDSVAFILNSLSRFAVPFFFITAGFMFTLKVKEKGYLNYYKKYVKLLLVPYLIWSFIYLLNGLFLTDLDTLDYLKNTLAPVDLLYYGEKISEPLWFLPGLFFSISITVIAIRFNFLKVLVPVALLLNLIGMFSEPQNLSIYYNLGVNTRDGLFFGLFYVSLGSLLADGSRYKRFIKRPKFWFILSLLFTLLMLIERFLLIELSQWRIYGDYYIFTIPLTFSLFMASLSKPELGRGRVISKLGRGALGIYLIHSLIMVWIQILFYNLFGRVVFTTIYWNLLFVPTVFTLSWVIYYFIPSVIRKRFSR